MTDEQREFSAAAFGVREYDNEHLRDAYVYRGYAEEIADKPMREIVPLVSVQDVVDCINQIYETAYEKHDDPEAVGNEMLGRIEELRGELEQLCDESVQDESGTIDDGQGVDRQ